MINSTKADANVRFRSGSSTVDEAGTTRQKIAFSRKYFTGANARHRQEIQICECRKFDSRKTESEQGPRAISPPFEGGNLDCKSPTPPSAGRQRPFRQNPRFLNILGIGSSLYTRRMVSAKNRDLDFKLPEPPTSSPVTGETIPAPPPSGPTSPVHPPAAPASSRAPSGQPCRRPCTRRPSLLEAEGFGSSS